MDLISSYQTNIYQLSMSYMAGRMLTIFFKRRFSFKVHTRNDVLDVLPVFLASFLVRLGSAWPFLGLLVALLCSNIRHIHDEMVKTVCLWASLHAAVYAQFSETTFACLAIACATTQFLRKPDKLKNWLREPRVIFGPIYVFMVCAGLRFCTAINDWPTILTALASLCSILAASIFRPDNNETLKLILPGTWPIPTTHKRQVIHGCLLFSSFLATFLKVIWLSDVNPSAFVMNALLGLGIVNATLYLSYKFKQGYTRTY